MLSMKKGFTCRMMLRYCSFASCASCAGVGALAPDPTGWVVGMGALGAIKGTGYSSIRGGISIWTPVIG